MESLLWAEKEFTSPYKSFQDGRVDVEDDEHPGRPITSVIGEHVENVEGMVMKI